jgi:stage II sporulation protein AA (anti-sigma F factor antagonist)
MNLTTVKIGTFAVLNIEGRIDTLNSRAFEAEIDKIFSRGGKDIILDCNEMRYISSSGLRVFLIAQKKIIALKGKLYVCNLQPSIREIFDISGFSSIFRIFGTRKEALES